MSADCPSDKELLPAISHTIDAQGRLLTVTNRWLSKLGYCRDEVIGKRSIEFFTPETRSRILCAEVPAFFERGFQDDVPAQMLTRSGAVIDVLMSSVLERDCSGKPVRGLTVIQDVTDQKKQDLVLRQSQELLTRTGEAAGVGGWQIEIATGELHWSEQTYLIHGVPNDYKPTVAEAINFYAPEARAIIKAAVDGSMIDGSLWDLELPFIRADGTRIWVRAVGKAEFEDGHPVRLSGAFQDVSAQVQQRQVLEALHQRLSLATQAGGVGTWEYNLVTDRFVWDQTMLRVYGLADDQQPSSSAEWMELLHPDDRERAREVILAAMKARKSFDLEFRIVRGDGTQRHVRSAAQCALGVDGQPSRVVGVNWDVTELREMALQIERQHELMRVTLHSIGDAVLTTDARGFVTWLNPTAEQLTGWSVSQARSLPFATVFRLFEEDFSAMSLKPVSACLVSGTLVDTDKPTLLLSQSGRRYGIEHCAAPIRSGNGELLGMVLVFRDVTEQRRLSGEMVHRASHDMLTGLVNRTEFESRLSGLLKRTQTEGGTHTVLYLDLDQFKLVNDACGHGVGDQLLVQVSKLLIESVRATDTIARLGGDEFGVILEHCSSEQAKRVADQICERMSDFRFSHEDRRFRIGASIGMVPVDQRWLSSAAVMQAADSACYAAKDAGRNRVHVWFDTDQTMRIRQGDMKWASRLEQALDEDRFVLFGQRIHALNVPARGLYAEVLVRLRDVDGTMVPPGAFLPAAERFHLASRLDRWVLRHTIKLLCSLSDIRGVETLSINLSGQSIGDRAFQREANQLLCAAGPEICSRICLEITETAAVTNIADAARFVEQVHDLGVRVSLDDFGSGASSFGYLKTLNVDQIKIDGQFIKDLLDDPLDEAAVRSFVEVARVVGAQTVAEFVDRPEVLERVRQIGIHYAQGFLLHRPEALEGLLAVLRDPALLV